MQALDVDGARRLRHVVDPAHCRTPGRRPNRGLADVDDVLLGTGLRIGEALALCWRDLDLDGDPRPCTWLERSWNPGGDTSMR